MKINFSEFGKKGFWVQFVKYDFWFGIDRLRIHYIDWAIGIVGVAALLVGIYYAINARKQNNPHSVVLWKRYSKVGIWIGLILILWFGLRYQNIQLFGTHFVALLIGLSGAGWWGYIYRHQKRKHQGNISSWENQKLKEKYLNMPSK